MRESPFARFIHTDTRNDSMLLDVDVNQELVNRLGLSNALVSGTLAGAFDGAPVSIFWEGDRAVAITLRLAPEDRTNFGDVKDAYISSPLTRVSSPLRSMASLKPAWQNSRIVHRNGVRTLTVRAFTERGHYGSELLGAIMPKVKGLQLPSGYRIDYGGEIANQNETFPQMVMALCISLVGIFLILLIQFRTISDPLVVMSSIPLALFGAMAGLLITGNPFGLTAFIGLISLCGIVVRNGIILVDYIKEKVAEGHSLETAAMEAGERRLRPIFLTTMAAAVGVTPMILSRSAMWSPLASVIAVGLICSMFFTLLVVPVLYVMVESRVEKRHQPAATATTLALLIVCLAAPLQAQGTSAPSRKKVTVDEAIHLALTNSSPVKISKAAVLENRAKVTVATGDYFPQLSTDGLYLVLDKPQGVTFPTGSLGTIPGLGPFPSQPMNINQGSNHLSLVNVTLAQPLTQLFKIRQGDRVASSDARASDAELKKTEATVAIGVRQIYYGILVAGKLKEAAQSAVDASELALRDSEKALQAGNVLAVSVTGAKAAWLQSRQSLLSADNQIADLSGDLVDLLGLPTGTELELVETVEPLVTPNHDELLKAAQAQNPELLVARETLAKAQAAHSAASLDYIPNIGAFARYTQQSGVPFISDHGFTYGLQASWTIFDWGKRRGAVGQRSAQVLQAEENLRRLENKVALDVEKGFRKLNQSQLTEEMAAEAMSLRIESDRLAGNQLKAGVIPPVKRAEAAAAARKAEADHLQAKLGLRLALADLERLAGKASR
jgi:outer membrane protein TolC/preprotein translocase subunit SecF